MSLSGLKSFARRQILSPFFVLYLLVAYIALLAPMRPEILRPSNLMDVAITSIPLIILAIGQTFVVVTAGIDLSVTAVVSCASVICGSVIRHMSDDAAFWVLTASFGVVVVVGAVIGVWHGACVALLRMPPLLVTLVSLMFLEGLANFVTQSRPIGDFPLQFVDMYYQTWLGIPAPIVVGLVIAVLTYLLLHRTITGKQLFAIGEKQETARVSGVPIQTSLITAYLLCSVLTSVAAWLYMMRLETGKPALIGESVLLDCIAAVVIGGTALSGGKGSIVGSILGALFLTFVANGLQLLGSLQIWHVMLVKGIIILLAASLQSLRSRIALEEGLTYA